MTPLVGAAFNKHNGNFVIVTANEIRQYDGANGQLLKIFSSVNDKRSQAEIKSFAFDSRSRKIILGDTEGTVW